MGVGVREGVGEGEGEGEGGAITRRRYCHSKTKRGGATTGVGED